MIEGEETFQAFNAWARTKNPEEPYHFVDRQNCAFAQFLKETGRATEPAVGGWGWTDPKPGQAPEDAEYHSIPGILSNVGTSAVPLQANTFGGLINRIDIRLKERNSG